MNAVQPNADSAQVKHAEQNAKGALEIISRVISERFGDEGVSALKERQRIFQEDFDNYPSDEVRLGLISQWAQDGVQQNEWATLDLDDLLEMACRLSLLRAFLGEANAMMEKKTKAAAQRHAEKKKKARAKMAQASRKSNRKK